MTFQKGVSGNPKGRPRKDVQALRIMEDGTPEEKLAALESLVIRWLEKAGQSRDRAGLVREAVAIFRLQAELEGRLRPQGSVEVNVAIVERERREMDALMSAVVQVLSEFPAARAAVLALLGKRDVEAVHAPPALALQAPHASDEPLPVEKRDA